MFTEIQFKQANIKQAIQNSGIMDTTIPSQSRSPFRKTVLS